MTDSDRNTTRAPRCVRLDHYACLRVTGADAAAFLQGQLSVDLDDAAATRGQIASFNTPQGRVIALPRLLRAGDTIWLVLPAGLSEPVAARLRQFILRAAVTVESAPAIRVWGLLYPAADAVPPIEGSRLLRLPADGLAMIVSGTETDMGAGLTRLPSGDPDEWTAAEVAAGLPEVFPATSGQFVAQMLNLDLLDGISFTKGCFVGQEIVARAHHLGRVKRRMGLFAAVRGHAAPGDTVYRGERAAGTVVRTAPLDAEREMILAVVAAGPEPVRLAGAPAGLETLKLPYSVPGVGSSG